MCFLYTSLYVSGYVWEERFCIDSALLLLDETRQFMCTMFYC